MKSIFENNAAVSGHHLTTKAAQEVLESGGNAFDAAIAAFFMAWVVEPTMAGAGGGGFANIYTKDGESMIFDFFCQTPKVKRPVSELNFYPVEIDFGGQKETFHIGEGSVATPGNVAGIFEIHAALGRIPISELASQAIERAKIGVEIVPFQRRIYGLTEKMLQKSFQYDNPYFKNEKLKEAGDKLHFYKKADFLDYLTQEGPDAFYKGEVAQKFISQSWANGGSLTVDDLKYYRVERRNTMKIPFYDQQLLLNPLPSLGGASIAVMDAFKSKNHNIKPFSKEHFKYLLGIQSQANDIPKSVTHLNTFLKKSGNNKLGSTTHLGVTDRWGNAISLTTSIGEGSGVHMLDTEILLNNMLGEAALLPNGFHSWKPDTRLGSMMTPTIVIDSNRKPVLVTGSSGAGRIPMAIFSVLDYALGSKMPIHDAVNTPRLHFDGELINVEPGFDIPTDLKHEVSEWDSNSMFFGGANSIMMEKGRWVAVVDERRDGLGYE